MGDVLPLKSARGSSGNGLDSPATAACNSSQPDSYTGRSEATIFGPPRSCRKRRDVQRNRDCICEAWRPSGKHRAVRDSVFSRWRASDTNKPNWYKNPTVLPIFHQSSSHACERVGLRLGGAEGATGPRDDAARQTAIVASLAALPDEFLPNWFAKCGYLQC